MLKENLGGLRFVPEVHHNIKQFPSRKHPYMINSLLKGEYSTIYIAYRRFLGLENGHNLPNIVF